MVGRGVGLATQETGAAASPHQAAADPTGHPEGTPTAPLESPHADPPLFSRLLSHPSRRLPFPPFPVPERRPLFTPGPALFGAPLP